MVQNIHIQFGVEDFIASLEVDVDLVNNGMGSYEYWGAPGYDAGEDYMEVQDITWDHDDHDDVQNHLIKLYVDINKEDIERKAIKHAWEEYHDGQMEAALNRAGL